MGNTYLVGFYIFKRKKCVWIDMEQWKNLVEQFPVIINWKFDF